MTAYTWAWVLAGLAVAVIVWLVVKPSKHKNPDNYIPGSPREPKGPRPSDP